MSLIGHFTQENQRRLQRRPGENQGWVRLSIPESRGN